MSKTDKKPTAREILSLTLIELQHEQGRSLTIDEFAQLAATKLPDEAKAASFADKVTQCCRELYANNLFAQASKVEGAKRVVRYGLPEHTPGGILYTDQARHQLDAKCERIASLFASSARSALERHITLLKMKNGESDLSIDDLKIDFALLKKINMETLARIRAEFENAMKAVANQLPDETA